MTAFFQHIHIGGDYGRKQLQQQLTLTALFTLLLVMPTLLKAQDTPDPTIQVRACYLPVAQDATVVGVDAS